MILVTSNVLDGLFEQVEACEGLDVSGAGFCVCLGPGTTGSRTGPSWRLLEATSGSSSAALLCLFDGDPSRNALLVCRQARRREFADVLVGSVAGAMLACGKSRFSSHVCSC